MKIKIPFKYRSQMTMKEKVSNPLSVEEALELDKDSIIPITDYWVNDTDGSSYNKLPFAVRMPKGLVTQAEEERRIRRYGYLSDLIPSFRGFDATHFPDGREKNKAVTM